MAFQRLDLGHGIGLRTKHFGRFLEERPAVDWVETISENFMAQGGRPLAVLEKVRRDMPVALHGVSLAIGSVDPIPERYLVDLERLVQRIEPALVWRPRYDVFHIKLDLDETVALESALAGEPLSRICAAFARREDPAGAAFAALSSWLQEGWVAGIDIVRPRVLRCARCCAARLAGSRRHRHWRHPRKPEIHRVIIVGGGIGGSAAALRAVQNGLRAAWIRGDARTTRSSRA
jgi:Protein of unknown function (DUF692)